eukprot:250208_1
MCSISLTIFSYVHGTIDALTVVVVIWIFYKYIKSGETSKLPKTMYITGLFFYFTAVLSFVFLSSMAYNFCEPRMSKSWLIKWSLFAISYAINWNALIIFLFYRLYYVFAGSTFSLSKICVAAFIIVYIIFVVSLIVGFTFMKLFWVFIGITFISAVYLSFYTSALFIFKLYQLNHANKVSDTAHIAASQDLISVITKFTILAILSISSTLLLAVYQIVLNATHVSLENEIARIIFNSLVLLDLCTNFICISLSFKFADDYYLLMCGKCDGCCRLLCHKKSPQPKLQMTSSNIASHSATSVNV